MPTHHFSLRQGKGLRAHLIHAAEVVTSLMLAAILILTLAGQATVASASDMDVEEEIVQVDDEPDIVVTLGVAQKAEPPVAVVLVDEVIEEEPIVWDISYGPQDPAGNAMTVYNFLLYEFPNAYEWLQENLTSEYWKGYLYEYEDLVFSKTLAIAVVGNAYRESSCTSDALQSFGSTSVWTLEQTYNNIANFGTDYLNAYGMWQWAGGRRLNLVTFCRDNGFDPRDPIIQCYYFAFEYYSTMGHSNFNGLRQFSETECTLENVIECAEYFRKHWERGGTYGVTGEILTNWANKWNSNWGAKPSTGLYAAILEAEETGVLWDGTTVQDRKG